MRLRPDMVLAGATLVAPLGAGGQGEVWSGTLEDGTEVAVKVLEGADPDQVIRAMREARLQGAVDSPNIVGVLDFQLVGDTPVILSELVRGISLQQLLRRGRPPLTDVDHIAQQLMDGVEAAHAHGLIHRDLKPANVLLEPSEDGFLVKITDFGIAMESAPFPGQRAPGHGDFAGTVGFMAPEQFRPGTKVDHRADLFGLGAVLYWLTTGRRAFSGAHRVQVMLRSEKGEFSPVLQVAPEVPEPWAQAIVWALDPSPHRRPQDVTVLRQAWLGGIRVPPWVATGRVVAVPTDPEFGGITDVDEPDDIEEPPLPESFGRDRDIDRIQRRLTSHRVVTLRGFAGIGKTHLALRVARQASEQFGIKTIFCQLTEATSEEGLLVALAAGLQMPVRGAAPLDLLGLALDGRGEVVVILDRAEQVTEPLGRMLPKLLAAAPGAQFLVTSRSSLGLAQETVVDVGPLDEEAGVALYLDRASRMRPQRKVSASRRKKVEELVRRLDGIPLAIELAAAQVGQTTLDALLAELGRGRAAGSPTMRAALDWSWKLLRPWEQATLARCAVFAGGFTPDAAEAVVDLSAWPGAPGMLEVLHGLADQSLVRVVRGADRLELYASVRAYALATLGPEERRAAEDAHLAWFRELGSPDGFAIRNGPAGVEATRRAMAEIDNLAVALDRALARRDAGAAGDCAAALGWVLTRSGPPNVGISRMHRVLGLRDLGPGPRARIQILLSHLLEDMADRAGSERALEEALVDARAAGDLELEVHALQGLGALVHHHGDLERAEGYFDQALALVDGSELPIWRRAAVQRTYSALLQHQGRLKEAEAAIMEAIALAEAHGVAVDLPACYIQLGSIRGHQGRPDEATVYERLALHGSRLIGDRVQEGRVLANLGVRLHELGQHDQAVIAFERSAELARKTGGRGHEAIALGNMGETLALVEREEEAEEALQRAIVLGDLTWKVVGAIFRATLARLRIQQGRYDEAETLLSEAEPVLEERHLPGFIGHLLTRAELEAHRGHRKAAAATLARADRMMRERELLHEAELQALRRRVIRLLGG